MSKTDYLEVEEILSHYPSLKVKAQYCAELKTGTVENDLYDTYDECMNTERTHEIEINRILLIITK